jgi:phosphatidate cytidylyltransferase
VTGTRVLTAAALIPVVVALVWFGPTWLVAAAVGLLIVATLLEFFSLGEKIGLYAYRAWTCVCSAAVLFEQWAASRGQQVTLGRNVYLTRSSALPQVPLELILLVFVFGAAAVVIFSQRPLSEALGNIGLSSAGLIFVALPLTALVRLHAVAEIGRRLLLFVLVLVWTGDTAAYFTGRAFGRRRMAPHLSPGKTWEGAVGNLVGSLAIGLAFARWLQIGVGHMLLMAALGSVAGQAGDLLESAYKRCAGAKDSGAVLPGHGGVFDRIDALLLAAPVVWYYFEMVLAK